MSKVFCVGFQKTGTTSMEVALGQPGYGVTSVFGRQYPIDGLRRRFVDIGPGIAERNDAVQDMPRTSMFRELDRAFPGAKCVLTVRDENA